MSKKEEETFINIPPSNKERFVEKFRLAQQGSLSWDVGKKEQYVKKLQEEGSKSPFTSKKYRAPGREILFWALAIGISYQKSFPSNNTSSTVPNNVFENSKYTSLLGRIAAILANDDVEIIFDPNEVRKSVENYANGGIAKLYNHCLGEKAGKDVEEGLMDLVREALPDAIEVLDRVSPTEILEEE